MSSNITLISKQSVDECDDDEQLTEIHTKATARVFKLDTVLKILKNADTTLLDVSDPEHVKNMLKVLAVQDYINLSETDKLLGIDNADSIKLSYDERKALREYLFKSIRELCLPAIQFFETIQKEIPNVFEGGANMREIIELEKKRQKLQDDLITAKAQKCELLKTSAEMKLAPYEEKQLDVILAEYKLNQIKIETLHAFLIQEFCTRTQYTTKAIKEVERYIDEELEKYEE